MKKTKPKGTSYVLLLHAHTKSRYPTPYSPPPSTRPPPLSLSLSLFFHLPPFPRIHDNLFSSFFYSVFSSLAIYLSVCLSVHHSPLYTLTNTNQSHDPRHRRGSLSFTRSTHSLAHSPALAHSYWVFYTIHDDCFTYVTSWTCRGRRVLSFENSTDGRIEQRKKGKKRKKKTNNVKKLYTERGWCFRV